MDNEILNQKLVMYEKINNNLRDELTETKKLIKLLESKIKIKDEKNTKLQSEKKKLQKQIRDLKRELGVDKEYIDIGEFQVDDIGLFQDKESDSINKVLFDKSIILDKNEINKFIIKNNGIINSYFKNINYELLDKKCRDKLVNYINKKHNKQTDFKLNIDKDNLINLIGYDMFSQIINIFGNNFTKIILRKVIPSRRYIRFHKDFSKKTMKISLNSHNNFEGGDVIYLSNGKVLKSRQDIDVITIHRDDIIHGVTPVTKAIMYI